MPQNNSIAFPNYGDRPQNPRRQPQGDELLGIVVRELGNDLPLAPRRLTLAWWWLAACVAGLATVFVALLPTNQSSSSRAPAPIVAALPAVQVASTTRAAPRNSAPRVKGLFLPSVSRLGQTVWGSLTVSDPDDNARTIVVDAFENGGRSEIRLSNPKGEYPVSFPLTCRQAGTHTVEVTARDANGLTSAPIRASTLCRAQPAPPPPANRAPQLLLLDLPPSTELRVDAQGFVRFIDPDNNVDSIVIESDGGVNRKSVGSGPSGTRSVAISVPCRRVGRVDVKVTVRDKGGLSSLPAFHSLQCRAPVPVQSARASDFRLDKPRYQVGDSVSVSFWLHQASFVYLINRDAGGRWALLPTDGAALGVWLPAGQQWLPHDKMGYVATLPLGRELAFLLVTAEPVHELLLALLPSLLAETNGSIADVSRMVGAWLGNNPCQLLYTTLQVG